ncbi:hypothetical protein WT01_27220 [Burkholderia cepacia]|nr:hypothetical protein WT01_27220 [Burkholderia cepacia]
MEYWGVSIFISNCAKSDIGLNVLSKYSSHRRVLAQIYGHHFLHLHLFFHASIFNQHKIFFRRIGFAR